MDSFTKSALNISDAVRLRRAAELKMKEATAELEAAGQYERQHNGRETFADMLDASGANEWSRVPQQRKMSAVLESTYGVARRTVNSFFVAEGLQTRTLVVGTPGAAGYLVAAAEPLAIEAARPSNNLLALCSVIGPMAAGNMIVGKLSTAPTCYMLASEATAISEASPATTQSAIKPKNATAFLTETRLHALQTGDRGARALRDMVIAALRTKVCTQILVGSGTNGEALGLVNDPTVTTASGTTVAWSTVCDTMALVEAGAGDAPLAWALTHTAAKILRQRAQISGGDAILKDGKIGGYPVIVIGGTTDAVAAFGRWSDLLLYEFAPLEFAVNPFQNFQGQIIGLRGWATFDCAPKVSGSFACISAIT